MSSPKRPSKPKAKRSPSCLPESGDPRVRHLLLADTLSVRQLAGSKESDRLRGDIRMIEAASVSVESALRLKQPCMADCFIPPEWIPFV